MKKPPAPIKSTMKRMAPKKDYNDMKQPVKGADTE